MEQMCNWMEVFEWNVWNVILKGVSEPAPLSAGE
jgi:hypothetical protein